MRHLLVYLRPFRGLIALVSILLFAQTLAELYLPTLMADIVDIGVLHGDIPYILQVGGWMLLVAACGMACMIAASYFSAKAASGFGRKLRNKLFAHVSSFSQQEFDRFGTASLITRTTNDIQQVQQVLIMMLRMMITAPLMCIGGIVMALITDRQLALVIIAVLPVLALAVLLIARKGMPLFRALQKKLDQLNLVQREGLTGIRVIRAFNRIEHEKRRFQKANEDLTDTAVKVNRLMAAMMPIMMLTVNISAVAIIWFGSIRIDGEYMLVGSLMAFIQYAMMILFSLLMMSMIFVMLPRAAASATRIHEVLSAEPSVTDKLARELDVNKEAAGKIEFRDVDFRYPGAEQPALHNISFTASVGETTAIIGGTGSGKSTLINLIPRFYDVERGAVLVDGIDVRNGRRSSCAAKSALSHSKRCCSPVRWRTTFATARRTRRRRSCWRRPRQHRHWSLFRRWKAHSTLQSHRAEAICRAARSSGCPSLVHSCASRTSMCSTTASPHWIIRRMRSCALR